MSWLANDIYSTNDIFVRRHFYLQYAGHAAFGWVVLMMRTGNLDGLETKGITSYMNLVMQRAKIEGFVV
jgi:predicted choloylglycine hydrolase